MTYTFVGNTRYSRAAAAVVVVEDVGNELVRFLAIVAVESAIASCAAEVVVVPAVPPDFSRIRKGQEV